MLPYAHPKRNILNTVLQILNLAELKKKSVYRVPINVLVSVLDMRDTNIFSVFSKVAFIIRQTCCIAIAMQ